MQGFQAFEDIVGDPYEVTRKPIRGWPGYYAGSDGRIYSLHSGDFEPVAEWEGGRKRCPYQKVTLYRTRCVWWHRDGKRGRRGRVAEKQNFFVHNLIALAFLGRRPRRSYQAAHKDGDRRNNRAGNLAWKTKRQNEADKVAHGTAPGRVGRTPGRVKIARTK